MTTYYHVAPASFTIGDDLLSFDEQEAHGMEPVWKWDCDYVDTDVVCLFTTIDEARDYRDESQPDGLILQINPDAELRLTHVTEGFPAVFAKIPARCITVV